jgi:plasmid maintenance system antidote protein VapI
MEKKRQPVPPRRINEIVLGKLAITADTAIRLGKVFRTSAELWLNLQNHYEMEPAKDKAPGWCSVRSGRLSREFEAWVFSKLGMTIRD